MADVIVFAVVALFLLWRLVSILGDDRRPNRKRGPARTSGPFSVFVDNLKQKNGDRNMRDVTDSSPKPEQPPVVDSGFRFLKANARPATINTSATAKGVFESESELLPKELLETYKSCYSASSGSFLISSFLDGVETVFETVVAALSGDGDLSSIKEVVSPECMEKLGELLKNRKPGEFIYLEKIESVVITDMRFNSSSLAEVDIKVTSLQIQYAVDQDMHVTSGSKVKPFKMEDTLHFFRYLSTPGSLWTLARIS